MKYKCPQLDIDSDRPETFGRAVGAFGSMPYGILRILLPEVNKIMPINGVQKMALPDGLLADTECIRRIYDVWGSPTLAERYAKFTGRSLSSQVFVIFALIRALPPDVRKNVLNAIIADNIDYAIMPFLHQETFSASYQELVVKDRHAAYDLVMDLILGTSLAKTQCQHEWVNVGFSFIKMVCKHCDQDKD